MMAQEKQKQLLRSRSDRWIAGVCGGLGKYFEVDPLIFRLIFILLTVFGGSGILIYVILWIAVPEEGDKEAQTRKPFEQKIKMGANKMADEIKQQLKDEKGWRANRGKLTGGLILLGLGLFFLIQNFFPLWDIARLWPVILIIIGLAILVGSSERR